MDITIFLSDNCNLRCDYCFFDKTDRKMSVETLTKILEWLAGCHEDSASILLGGGEPFLAFDLMKAVPDIWSKVARDGQKLKFSAIFTNGTLLNDEIIDFLNANRMGIQVSLDGLDYESNRHRFKGNKALFDLARANVISYIRKIRYPSDIWMTVTPENVTSLRKNVENFINEGLHRLVIRPAGGFIWSKADMELFWDNYEAVVKFRKRLHERCLGGEIRIQPIDRHLEQMMHQKQGEAQSLLSITFTPSGEAFACPLFAQMSASQAGRFSLGHPDGGRIQQKFQELCKLGRCHGEYAKEEYGPLLCEVWCSKVCKIIFPDYGGSYRREAIRNSLDLENGMFKRVYKVYFHDNKTQGLGSYGESRSTEQDTI
jgi:sulfatase maturation enzyme AslB (radical SAM superfamily)